MLLLHPRTVYRVLVYIELSSSTTESWSNFKSTQSVPDNQTIYTVKGSGMHFIYDEILFIYAKF
jgi:hypothetical protein